MISVNPFEALATTQLTAAAKRKHQAADRRANKSVVMSEADAPMKGTAAEAARDERNAQMAGYRRHKAQERDELINGPFGRDTGELMQMLRSLTFDGADKLVQTVQAKHWFRNADQATKHAILSLIADAILRLRVRSGLAPFDDAIGDEPPTAFQIIRRGMIGV